MPVWLIPLILQIFANLPALIMMAEKAFSGTPGSGEAKKELVLNSVKAAVTVYKTVNPADIPPEAEKAILTATSSLTDATVQTLNAYNLLKPV
jgi:hypothetical protein